MSVYRKSSPQSVMVDVGSRQMIRQKVSGAVQPSLWTSFLHHSGGGWASQIDHRGSFIAVFS